MSIFPYVDHDIKVKDIVENVSEQLKGLCFQDANNILEETKIYIKQNTKV